jgi:cytochrome P450
MVLQFFWDADKPWSSIGFILFSVLLSFVLWKSITYYLYVSKYKGRYPGPGMVMGGMMPPKEMAEKGGFTEFMEWGHQTYGPIFEFFMGFEYHVSIDDPKALAQVHNKAPERPDSTFKVVNYLFKENILFQHGEWQRILRRSYQGIIDSPEVRQKLQSEAFKGLEEDTKNWGGSEVDVFGTFHRMIYDVMGKVLFGQAWSTTEVGQRIKKSHLHCVENVMRFVLNPMDRGPEYKAYNQNRQKFWDELSGLIGVRREELKKGATVNKEYAVDMCLTAKRKDLQPNFYKDDKNPEALIYDNGTAVATMAVFLNGSFDTTLNSTTWTLYWFAKHPEIQKKFQEELDKSGVNLKEGCPTPPKDELEKIPYLDAVIREGMRKMPAAPINMRINFDKDYDIDNLDKDAWGKYGYKDKVTIPAGTTVILPYHCAMMKESVFGADCPHFNPERFVGEDTDAKGSNADRCGRHLAVTSACVWVKTLPSKRSACFSLCCFQGTPSNSKIRMKRSEQSMKPASMSLMSLRMESPQVESLNLLSRNVDVLDGLAEKSYGPASSLHSCAPMHRVNGMSMSWPSVLNSKLRRVVS